MGQLKALRFSSLLASSSHEQGTGVLGGSLHLKPLGKLQKMALPLSWLEMSMHLDGARFISTSTTCSTQIPGGNGSPEMFQDGSEICCQL